MIAAIAVAAIKVAAIHLFSFGVFMGVYFLLKASTIWKKIDDAVTIITQIRTSLSMIVPMMSKMFIWRKQIRNRQTMPPHGGSGLATPP
jgi:NADH:ubiquinone oxidoreductase subunit 5 (subunit L)/multisubunit Na+/H+ antiporter MnhA subunit